MTNFISKTTHHFVSVNKLKNQIIFEIVYIVEIKGFLDARIKEPLKTLFKYKGFFTLTMKSKRR